VANADPISEPQKKYIKDLVTKRDITSLSDAQKEFLDPPILEVRQMTLEDVKEEYEKLQEANLSLMNKGQASEAIKALLACPFKPVEQPQPQTQPEVLISPGGEEVVIEVPLDDPVPEVQGAPGINYSRENEPQVQQGYFFVVDPTEDDPAKVEKFFRVRHGKEGTKWQGYQFLDVQASDFFYPIKDQRRRFLILSEIAKDPVKAMNEYGLRLGRCGVCNRTLTDRHSILRGIGPVCAERLGPTDEQEEMLRRLGLIKD